MFKSFSLSRTSNYVNLTTAYLLWALGFFGLFGLHRIYLGRPVSGVIWFFSFGILFVGQFVDFFLIPDMVKARKNELLLKATISIPKSHPMRELLTVAQEHGNVLSLSQAIIGTNLSPEEAQKLLIDAVKKELAHVDNDPITGLSLIHI